ncbi:hypothetical protein CDL12_16287 [Handroanthus impetiginosus]|uniref:C2H2-type domain-containing protein n=1 Tax=Handroanthus impetiginosus TaxID=429701 RepID=A0A2G9H0R3_9LAMI|nr:hypothetical protein CDL12_16287 [Handroanthus impetiginosus]
MEKLKWGNSWDGANLSFEKDRAYGFSWPQRNYRCSFCKKEFKSAQALGGHMNVHRRDRARMRLSPNSCDSPSPNPNPNPNANPTPNSKPSFSLSSSSFKVLPYNMGWQYSSSSSSLSQEKGLMVVDRTKRDVVSTFCREDEGGKKKESMIEFTSFTRRKDARVWKGNEFVRLDLNLGMIQDGKEDLDLELRLGYS